MDEIAMRRLAARLLAELPAVVADPGERAEVRELLDGALARPSGQAGRQLRRVFARPPVRRWLRRQRPSERDGFKLHLDDDRLPVRYLTGACPQEILVGQRFPLEVAVTRRSHDDRDSVQLKAFAVPPEGVQVRVVLRPDRLTTDDDMVRELFVPPDEEKRDSDPVLFVLTAPRDGVYRPSIGMYVGGKPVGELRMEITAGTWSGSPNGARSTPLNDLVVEGGELAFDIVRRGGGYDYRLIADGVVESEHHSQFPTDLVAMLHGELTRLATSRDYDETSARRHLEDLGLRLWNSAVPGRIKECFWAQLDAIRSVSVVTDLHAVPWELMFPHTRGRDGLFLAERFPVVRRTTGQGHQRSLDLSRVAYVHPPRSPSGVADELAAVREILGERATHLPVISGWAELDTLLRQGDFGLLHVACHNESRNHGWDRISMAGGQFTTVNLEKAKSDRTLVRAGPLVFFNACRTTGGAVDTCFQSWAAGFLAAGAGAFVGSVWPVRSDAARRYALSFYNALVDDGMSLGGASLAAREAIKDLQDPTWLAYAVYGSASAVVTRV